MFAGKRFRLFYILSSANNVSRDLMTVLSCSIIEKNPQ